MTFECASMPFTLSKLHLSFQLSTLELWGSRKSLDCVDRKASD